MEIGAWSFTVAPVREHDVTLRVALSTVTYGGTVRLSGSIDLPLDAQLVLERALAGGAWGAVATLSPDASGEFARTIPASATARYRARIVASTTEGGVSPSIRVLVRRGVTISGAPPGATSTGSVGRTRSTTVTLSPRGPDVVVTLTVTRYDPVARQWRAYAALHRTTTAGRASFSWRPTSAGSYQVRASTPTSVLFANGVSAAQRWTIR